MDKNRRTIPHDDEKRVAHHPPLFHQQCLHQEMTDVFILVQNLQSTMCMVKRLQMIEAEGQNGQVMMVRGLINHPVLDIIMPYQMRHCHYINLTSCRGTIQCLL